MKKLAIVAKPQVMDRRSFLGGSDMAAVLGLSPYATPYQVWCEKTAEHAPEPDPQRAIYFRRGKMLEPYVIEMAREEHGLDVVARNRRYIDPELPFLSCEIDFEHEHGGALENADVKTVHMSKFKEWGEPGTDEIPQHYTVQFLFGQMVTARDSTLCMALFGMDRLEPYRVRRDAAVIGWMRQRAVSFWEMVQTRTAPEVTTLEDAKLRWARESGVRQIEASAEVIEIAHRLRLLRSSMAGDQAKCDLLELDLKKFIGDHEEVVNSQGERVATWKTQARKAYSVQAGESRVLRLTGGNL